MQLNEFKAHLESKITELLSMPSHGDECDDSVFDESEFLDYCADVVRDIYIRAAAFGFIKEPPAKLMDRDEALYYLRQVLAFLGGQSTECELINHDGPYSVKEAAIITRISKRKIYQDCKNGKIHHSTDPIRITKDALDQYERDRERHPVKTTGFKHL